MHPRIYHLSILTATLLFSPICPVQPTTNNLGIKNALAQTQNKQSSPASSLQDRKAEATRLLQRGQQQHSQSQFREALQTLQQALVIAREIGDKTLTGIALNEIGLVYNYLGQYPKALEFYQQALAIHREVNNKAEEGATLSSIGFVYGNLGQYPKALEFYQQALAILREIGNKAGEGRTLTNIGAVLGGPDADGLEIAGISYYFLNRGAKAVMASLWQVSDLSTSLLMQNFYSNLAKGNITKTAALRQAQLSLLNGNQRQFTHPYYWSAFILIGNGL